MISSSMLRRATQTLKGYLRLAGYVRWFRILVALVVVISAFIPTLIQLSELKAYALSDDVEKVLGTANRNLSAKFSFDKESNKWQFNKNGAAALASNIAQQQGSKDAEGVAQALSQLTAKQVGGSGQKDTSLYSVDLPVKAEEGITYYDNVTKLSFKMIPTFSTRDAKLVDGRIVYPFSGAGKIVYTAKTNGLKEDIVLSEYIGDSLRYGYTLELPEALEARLLDDGSIGIYSANPALFGDITFSNEDDKASVMDARKNGHKDNLVFGIPAPFIKDQTGKVGHTRYELDGKKLTVVASALKDLHYPLAVDPSVTITSSSDFQNGNDEGMIGFDTANQLSRGTLTGATFNTWAFTDNSANRGATQNGGSGAANGMIANRHSHGLTVYNGYIYALGGSNNSGLINPGSVERAPINSNGTLGTWVASGNLPEARHSGIALAYNGYIYIVGGYTGGADFSADVKFAPINSSDGSLGSWSSTTSMPVGRTNHGVTIYNGMMYIVNGCTRNSGQCNTGNPTAAAYCAEIYATGQLGTWNSTCGTTGLTARDGFTIVAYNGYIYGAGGCATYNLAACTSQPTTIQYAKINSDGTLGSWQTTATSFSTGRGEANLVINNGFIYLTGGETQGYTNVMQYAAILANGDIGAWRTGNSYVTARSETSVAVYKNNLYIVGGCSSWTTACSATRNDVQYAQIHTAGATSSYTSGTYDTTRRLSFGATVYNNYIYMVGGTSAANGARSSMHNTARYAPINTDGTIGSWSTSSSGFNQVNSASSPQTCDSQATCPGRVNTAVGAYNGYLYIAGGVSNGTVDQWSDVQSAVICTGANTPVSGCAGAGDLRNWTTLFTDFTTNSTTTYTETNGRSHVSMVIYNGIMYLMGGANSSGTVSANIYRSTLTSSGGAGNFTLDSVSLPSGNGRGGPRSFVYDNKLYIVGGGSTGAVWSHVGNEYNDVQFIPLNSDGSLDGTTGWKDANAAINGGSGSSFSAANSLEAYAAGVSNGQVYVISGRIGNVEQATVHRAAINTNGSMGAWSTTVSVGTARVSPKAVTARGYLYVIGGCSASTILVGNSCASADPGIQTTYEYARLHNGGGGGPATWTNSASTATNSVGGYAAYNGYVYALKGCAGALLTGDLACQSGSIVSSMKYAAINVDGTFGTWTSLSTAGAPPSDRFGLSAVAYNGYLYVLGGCTALTSNACSGFSREVYYAPINSNGDVGTWATTTDFDASTGRYGLSAAAYNGYMYVVGGCTAASSGNCTTYDNTVRVAQINSNGTLGSWSSAGSSFTTGRFFHGAVAHNGKLYVMGGCSVMASESCTTLHNDVQMITLGSGGSFSGSWQTGRQFVTARAGFGTVAYNGYLYIVGGCSQFNASGGVCANYLSDVQFAPISANGYTGVWNVTQSLADGITGHGLVVTNGRLVTMFGLKSPHSYVQTGSSSPLDVQSRVGQYSKLISVNPTTDIAGVHYNATLGDGSSVKYRVAPSSGVFGAVTAATQGTGSEPTPMCGMGSIYYVQLITTIDDTNKAVFGDTGASNITDVTIYYRLNATPPPNLRLNGGKWFYSETQQPLDICRL